MRERERESEREREREGVREREGGREGQRERSNILCTRGKRQYPTHTWKTPTYTGLLRLD